MTRYVHRRGDVIEPLLAWFDAPASTPVRLLRGRAGAGKSTTLASLAVAAAERAGVIVVTGNLRRPEDEDPVQLSEPVLVDDIRTAAGRDTPGVATVNPDTVVHGTVNAREVYGSATGVYIEKQYVASGGETVGSLIPVLRRRAERPHSPMLVVIDGLDELEWSAPHTFLALENLIGHADDLLRSNVRVVFGSRTVPRWIAALSEDVVIDIEDSAAAEIEQYAHTRLTELERAFDGRDAAQTARAIAHRAGGLFIVAAGYLDEIERGEVPEDLWHRESLPNATEYFNNALRRVYDSLDRRPGRYPGEFADTERFLAMLALTDSPVTDDQLSRLWSAQPEPRPAFWNEVARAEPTWAFGSYVERAGGDGTTDWRRGPYRLFHPCVREAVLNQVQRHHPGLLRREREGYLRSLTPLFESGTQWDGTRWRSVLQDAPSVLADLLTALVEGDPDAPQVDEWTARAAQLVDSWEWMECCLAWQDDTSPVPLGPATVIRGLRRLAEVGTAITLWPQGRAAELAKPLAPEEPRPRGGLRPSVPPPRARETGPRDPSKPWYPRANDPALTPLLRGRARFPTREDAVARLDGLRAQFTVSKKHAELEPPGSVVLWVRDYEITPAEREAGAVGNFMALIPRERNGYTVIHVAKRYVPVRYHPVKDRPVSGTRTHPDWGERVLRTARGGTGAEQPYETRRDAEAALESLRNRYPKATRSSTHPGRLDVLIYEGRDHRPSPVGQYTLYVQPADEGRFVVVVEPGDGSRAHAAGAEAS